MTDLKKQKCVSCFQIREAHGLDYESTCIDCRAKELKMLEKMDLEKLIEAAADNYGSDYRKPERNYFENAFKTGAQFVLERTKILIGTLNSIAAEHRLQQDTKEFWLNIKHEDCADVLATDTKIAREALEQWRSNGK